MIKVIRSPVIGLWSAAVSAIAVATALVLHQTGQIDTASLVLIAGFSASAFAIAWIAAQHNAHRDELASQNQRFKDAFENLGQGLTMYDHDNKLVICNSALSRNLRPGSGNRQAWNRPAHHRDAPARRQAAGRRFRQAHGEVLRADARAQELYADAIPAGRANPAGQQLSAPRGRMGRDPRRRHGPRAGAQGARAGRSHAAPAEPAVPGRARKPRPRVDDV